MYTFITILIIIVCVLLALVVLVQNPKGGGLGAGFGGGGGGGALGGVQKTTDFLEKATWTLAIALLALSLVSNAFLDKSANNGGIQDSELIEIINDDADLD